MYESVGRTFWEGLRVRGDAPALWVLDQDGDGVPDGVTSARLQSMAAQIAIGLTELELTAGQRVLVHAPLGPESLLVSLAAWMLGAVTVHVDPSMSAENLGTALGRMNAGWIVVPDVPSLADLELASGDSLSAAHVLVLGAGPAEPVPRITPFSEIKSLGRKFRATGTAKLAKAVFAVPGDARAAILYWQRKSNGELGAAALNHADLLAGLGTLPTSWGIGIDDCALLDVQCGTRMGLFATLQLLHAGCALLLTPVGAREVRPTLLVSANAGMERFIAEVEAEMEGKLTSRVRERLGRESDPARGVSKHLGKSVRLAWCLDAPSERTRGVFERAGIRLVETP